MKLGLELATALLILCMLSFGLLAFVEREERAASTTSVFSGPLARLMPFAYLAALLGIAAPTLTGDATGIIAVSATGVALGFAYTAMTHARWHHPLRAAIFTLLALVALALAWGRAGAYAL